MWRRCVLAAVAAAAVVPAVPVVHAASAVPWHRWAAPVGGVFRSGGYVDGEWVYTNGVGQGLGPNTDRLHRDEYTAAVRPVSDDGYRLTTCDLFGTHRAWHNGDFVLPTNRTAYPDFTGEVAELRLAVDGTNVFVRFLFPSFPSRDAQIATLTFAPAGRRAAPTAWPSNARVKSDWTVAVTTWGTGASVATGTGSRDISAAGGAVRTTDHAIELRLPLALLPRGRWLITGGAGLTDPLDRTQYWTVPPGDATAATPGNEGLPIANTLSDLPANVWDLLFADDVPWAFDERNQADLLGGGEVTYAQQVVDPALLRAHATRPAPVRIGRQSRLLASGIGTADGIQRSYIDFTDGGNSGGYAAPVPPNDSPVGEPGVGREYLYTGKLQYYGMYVPPSYPTARKALPLIIYLHGLNGLPCEPFNNVDGIEQPLEQRGYLLAAPLGRGDYWYRGAGERDVLDVLRDVQRHYRVDPNRIYLMGHSMGGAGTYNIALRHPDLFAAVAPVEGVDSAGLWRNAQNLPWFHIGAAFDADPDATAGKAFYAHLASQGWDATLLEYHSKTHEYSTVYDTLPQLFDFFDAHRRTPNPAHVSFTIPSDADQRLGLADDSAYWVRRLEQRTGATASVTATTFGVPHRDIDVKYSRHIDEEQTDQGGSNGHDTSAVYLRTIPAYGPRQAVRNAADVRLSGARAVELDLTRMHLSPARVLTITWHADGPTLLRLDAAWEGRVTVRIDGHPVTATGTGTLSFTVPTGAHLITVQPVKSAR
jgi:pimeloyl-ACP methyl ester carboxylesterase